MRIALVSPYDFAFPGGVTKHIANLSLKLREMGHHTIILAPMSRNGATPPAELIPLSFFVVPVYYNGSRARLCISPFIGRTVRRILKWYMPDVVHLHEPTNPTLPRAVLREASELVPEAVILGTFHAYRETHKRNELERLLNFAHRSACRGVAARLDGRIAVSLLAQEYACGIVPGPYRIIPNGVDLTLFGDRHIEPLPEFAEGINILFVGRLEARKGVSCLLDAFARVKSELPHTRLLIVGPYSASDMKPLEHRIRSLSLRDVHFLGCLPERELARCYRTAHVFCAPSLGSESFGMVLLEAMAAGLPIVASDIAGYRMVVRHQKEAYLVPPGNVEAIAQGLLTLLCQPDLRYSMVKQGQATVSRYTWEKISTEILDFYIDLRREKQAELYRAQSYIQQSLSVSHEMERVN